MSSWTTRQSPAPEEFANQPAIQGRVLEAIGRTYFDVGFYDKASDSLSRAESVTRPVSEKTADLRSRLSQFNSEAPIRFTLTLLRCECLIRSGKYDEAGSLLVSLESLIAGIEATQAAGTISEEEAAKWKERIARDRREIVRLRQIGAGAVD
jgi:hypothetical protein